MEIAIQLAKLIGFVMGAALGVLGLTRELKSADTKKLTFAGRLALAGIILSGVVALVADRLDHYRQARKAAEEAEGFRLSVDRQIKTIANLETLLREVQRSQQPIEGMRVRVSFRIGSNHLKAKSMLEKIRPELTTIRSTYGGVNWIGGSDGVLVNPLWGEKFADIESIIFRPDAKVFPGQEMHFSLAVAILHQGKSPERFVFTGPEKEWADMIFGLSSGRMDFGQVVYYPRTGTFEVEFVEAPGSLTTAPNLVGLRDLEGKEIVIGVLSYAKNEEQVNIGEIAFLSATGVQYRVPTNAFKEFGNGWPQPTFIAQMPAFLGGP
jgi:hypothetical protein